MCIYAKNGTKTLLKRGIYDMKLPFKMWMSSTKIAFSMNVQHEIVLQMNVNMCEYIYSMKLPLKCMNIYVNEMWTYSKNAIQNGVGR